MVKKSHFYLLSNLFLISVPSISYAHGLNVRYELPLPLYTYLISSVFIIIITLIFSKKFIKRDISSDKNLGERHIYKNNYSGYIAFLFLLFLIAIGYFGDQGALNNLVNVFIWVWFWVGFAYLSILSGTFWPRLNPWFIPYSYLIKILYKFKTIRKYKRNSIREINIIGIILLILFLWFAIIYPLREIPRNLSLFLVVYSLVTFVGMLVYGRNKWFNNAEIFSLYFSMLGRIGIYTPNNKSYKKKFRKPFSGIKMGNKNLFPAVFIIIAISSISFDGVLETQFWHDLKLLIITIPILIPIFKNLLFLFANLDILLNTLGFIIMPIILLIFYYLSCRKAYNYTDKNYNIRDILIIFSPSLVPIAAAYHIAHYFSFLLIAGQIGFPLLSDPFNLGWNLIGLSDYKVNPYIINAKIGWSVILITVIIGHLASIIVSQKISYTISIKKSNAEKIHFPLSIFMILYTVFSLWILSEPIVH
jgi:hypothetical protein